MDPYRLAERVDSRCPGARSFDDPIGALARLEALADAAPQDRALAALVPALADRIAAQDRAPLVQAGVRREALVRWDAFSATFRGARLADGAPAMVRVLRPEAARDPILRRHLVREGRALRAWLPVEVDEDPPAVRLALVGLPAGPVRGVALARALATGLAALLACDRVGAGLPPLAPEELRTGPAGVGIACLSAAEPGLAPAVATLAATVVDADDDGPLADLARALVAAPPAPGEAAAEVARAMAATLAGQRHALASRWRTGRQRVLRERLYAAVERLGAVVPPPEGRGAVGVDLEGRITVVETRSRAIVWGPAGGAQVVWDADGFRAPVARRMLRARAASPPNGTLDARVGGDGAEVDAICRWVSAGLQLRTVRLLLEKDPS